MSSSDEIDLQPEADNLLTALVESRLVDANKIESAISQIDVGQGQNRPYQIIKTLIEQELFTKYQIHTIAKKKSQSLIVGPFVLDEPVSNAITSRYFHAHSRGDHQDKSYLQLFPLQSVWQTRETKRLLSNLTQLAMPEGVLPLQDIGTVGRWHYARWPFVAGQTLREYVLCKQTLMLSEVAELMALIIEYLVKLEEIGHRHGFIHPANCLLATDGSVRLLNFGMSRLLELNLGADSMLDRFLRTQLASEYVFYTAPEILSLHHEPDCISEIFSLGQAMGFALTGLLPSRSCSFREFMNQCEANSSAEVTITPGYSRSPLVTLIDRMTQADRQLRPKSWHEILEELQEIFIPHSQSRAELAVNNSNDSGKLYSAPIDQIEDIFLSQPMSAITIPQTPEDEDGRISFDDTVADEYGNDFFPALPPNPVPSQEVPAQASTPPQKASQDLPNEVKLPHSIRLPDHLESSPKSAASEKLKSTATKTVVSVQTLPKPISWQNTLPEGLVAENLLPDIVVPPIPPHLVSPLSSSKKSLFFWRAESDVIQISIFGPLTIAPGQRVTFQVYLHLPSNYSGVATLCRAMHPTAELIGAGYIDSRVSHGTQLNLQLHMSSAGVSKSALEVSWNGQTQPRSFEVFVPWESPAGIANGVLISKQTEKENAQIQLRYLVLPRTA